MSVDSSLGIVPYEIDETDGIGVPRRLWNRSGMHRAKIAVLALLVFAFDTFTKVDVIVPVLYVIVVMLAMQSGRRRDVLIAGWGSIALTIISFVISFSPFSPTEPMSMATPGIWVALLNNVLSFLAIVSVMFLCLKNIESQTEIIRARGRVARVSRGMSLREISASVVHEVSQPLTAIRTNAEAAYRWLSQSPPNLEETKTASRRVVAEVERASQVIGSLRRLLMPGDISLEACEALSMIERAAEHLALEIDEEGIAFTFTCPSNLKVVADAVLLEQVLINAISNSIDALRAIEPGKRYIRIEAKPQPGYVQIAVRDGGTGSDSATLERIFEPFFTTKKEVGMGIGLAISKSIIDAHGGSIRACPNAPQGLVIEIEIPAADPR